MSKPDIVPNTTTAGIAVDPRTLERVIPESKRSDGTLRKEIKIRPGFTPQEDVSRFRGKRQAQMDATALPKGHIIGWVPPSTSSPTITVGKSKNAKKAEKRKEKRKVEAAKKVADSWEDDDDDAASAAEKSGDTKDKAASSGKGEKDDGGLAEKMEKLAV